MGQLIIYATLSEHSELYPTTHFAFETSHPSGPISIRRRINFGRIVPRCYHKTEISIKNFTQHRSLGDGI